MTTTDLYAPCPCGSGKKTKFCCRDILAEIEKIQRMIRADQRHVVLDKIDKLLQKYPDRPALISFRGRALTELGQFDEAQRMFERLLEIDPSNIFGLAMKAMTSSAGDQPLSCLPYLHHALGESKGQLSDILQNAMLGACVNLVRANHFLPAYAHARLLWALMPEERELPADLFAQIAASDFISLEFAGLEFDLTCPPRVTWKREFEIAVRHYRDGNWTAALRVLEGMSIRILDEPTLLRNQAILQVWLGRPEQAAKSWRMLASVRGLRIEEAVEAEAMALKLVPPAEPPIHAVQFVVDIQDTDAMLERLRSHELVSRAGAKPPASDGAPGPRGEFIVFDSPLPSHHASIDDPLSIDSLLQLPQQVGAVVIFGNQTDRHACAVMQVVQDDKYAERLQQLSTVLGIEIPPDISTQLTDTMTPLAHLLRMPLRHPGTLSVSRYNHSHQLWIEYRVHQGWANLPSAALKGKSPREAAQEPKLQRTVLALLLNLQIHCDPRHVWIDHVSFRAALGLPPQDSVPPRNQFLSAASFMQSELAKLDNKGLLELYQLLTQHLEGALFRRTALEVLRRPELEAEVDFADLHLRLSQQLLGRDDALAHMHQGRDVCIRRGESPAMWLVREFELRITHGEMEQAQQLMTEIQTRYDRDPIVQKSLNTLLKHYSPSRSPVPRSPVAVPAHEPTSGGIWTPETPEPGKLWVPGMD